MIKWWRDKLFKVKKGPSPKKASIYTRDFYPGFEIGEFTYGRPTILERDSPSTLRIGKFCSIADNVTIMLGGEHRPELVTSYPFTVFFLGEPMYQSDPKTKGDIIIGNDIWICRDTLILSGVTIGDGAVIGAGSVITKNVPPYAVMGGNPAKVIRYRFEESVVKELLEIKWWNWDVEKIKEALPFIINTDIDQFIAYTKQKK